MRKRDGSVLLVKRPDTGLWDFPSGWVDPGESPGRAVVRKVLEETGLEAWPRRLLGVYGGVSLRTALPNGDEYESVCILFECELAGGLLVRNGVENSEIRYFSLGALPELRESYLEAELSRLAEGRPFFQWDESWLDEVTSVPPA